MFLCWNWPRENFGKELCPVYQKSAFFEKKIPIIWLEIIFEFISKIPNQKIGNFKNGFAFLKTFLVKLWKFLRIDHFYSWFPRTYRKIIYRRRKKSFVGPTFTRLETHSFEKIVSKKKFTIVIISLKISKLYLKIRFKFDNFWLWGFYRPEGVFKELITFNY